MTRSSPSRSPEDDPELVLWKRQCRAEFKQAFHEAVAKLETRERNLLRMHLLDGLSIDRIGRFYRVHRATAFRWIGRARENVWRETRRLVSLRMQLTPSDCDRALQTVRSQLDLSIERALQPG